MKKIGFFLLSVVVSISSVDAKPKKTVLSTPKDSATYAILNVSNIRDYISRTE